MWRDTLRCQGWNSAHEMNDKHRNISRDTLFSSLLGRGTAQKLQASWVIFQGLLQFCILAIPSRRSWAGREKGKPAWGWRTPVGVSLFARLFELRIDAFSRLGFRAVTAELFHRVQWFDNCRLQLETQRSYSELSPLCLFSSPNSFLPFEALMFPDMENWAGGWGDQQACQEGRSLIILWGTVQN